MNAWVLVFMLNGQPSSLPPMSAEGCLLEMITKNILQQDPHCINKETGLKVLPKAPYSTDRMYALRMTYLQAQSDKRQRQ